MSFYAADGSINVTAVDGTTRTGVYAANGSINVVVTPSPVTRPVGAYHKCGAWYVTVTTSPVLSKRAPDGSLYVSVSPYQKGSTKVTVVSGSLSSGSFILREDGSYVLRESGDRVERETF